MYSLHEYLYAPFIKHQGTGIIDPEGYAVAPAQFIAGQFPDGNIEIVALSNIPMRIRTGYDGLMTPSKSKIEGETSEKFRFVAEGPCNTSFSFSQEGNSSTTVINPEYMEITNTDALPPKTIHFGLTSFKFSDILGFAVDNNTININYQGIPIKITPSVNYTNFKKRLQQKKYIDMTAIAEIPLASNQEIDNHKTNISNLCRLLSIAQGTIINWIFYVILSSDDDFVQSFHRKAIVRPPTNFSIISCKDVQDFLNVSMQEYDKVIGGEIIDLACISSYLDAFTENINVRTRAISLVVTIERIAHLYKNRAIRLTYGEDNSTFRKTLNSMCSRYALDNTDVPRVLEHRNSLVHEALFKDITDTYSVEKNAIEAFGVLNRFTSRLILAMLNYRGSYLEWLDIPPKLQRVS